MLKSSCACLTSPHTVSSNRSALHVLACVPSVIRATACGTCRHCIEMTHYKVKQNPLIIRCLQNLLFALSLTCNVFCFKNASMLVHQVPACHGHTASRRTTDAHRCFLPALSTVPVSGVLTQTGVQTITVETATLCQNIT